MSTRKIRVSTKPTVPMSVRSKIKRFRRDFILALDDIRAQMKDQTAFFEVQWDSVCRKLSKTWGLKRKRHTGMSNFFFVSKKHGFVVKRSYLCTNGFDVPKCAIFTEAIPFKHEYDDCDTDGPVYVQPLAKVDYDSRELAYDAITESDLEPEDCHEHNVAIYRGKAVVIDW